MSEHKKFSQIGLENGVFETMTTRKFDKRRLYEKQDPGIIKAVIPGVVAEINARSGAIVKKGDTLMILEAMKMLNRIMASKDGIIKTIRVKKGDKVVKGQVLIEMK